MTVSEQIRKISRRKGPKIPPGPELRFTQVPVVEDFLCGSPFSLLFTEGERLQDPRLLKQLRKQNNTELGLEEYLRHLEGLSVPGLEEAKEHLREKYRRNCKPSTLKGTVTALKLFLAFFKEGGKRGIEELKRQDIEAFVEHEFDRGLKPLSVRARYAILHAFLVFLVDQGVVNPEVILRPIKIKLPRKLPRAMDPEHVRRLLAVLEEGRNGALILVLLRTGMRIGELLSTKVGDVHLTQRRIDIPQASKNITGRVVYLSEDALEYLEHWFQVRDERKTYLFYSQNKHRMGYANARSIFLKHLKRAGLTGKGYGLHTLRHTFASEALNAGMRIECLQQILGHSNLEVTRQYARLTDVTREEEYFRAMKIIEKGGIHGHYQLDSELRAILEEKKQLAQHPEALLERLEAVSRMGRRPR